MELKDLTNKLLNETKTIFESMAEMDVDWNFPTVTILTKAEKSKEAGSGGTTDDSAQTEIIDPENQEPNNGPGGDFGGDSSEGGEGEGSDGGGSETNKVKVGSIIQDFTTGEYGKVTSIDNNGDVEWEPVSKDELVKQGFFAAKRFGVSELPKKITKFNRSMLDGFIG